MVVVADQVNEDAWADAFRELDARRYTAVVVVPHDAGVDVMDVGRAARNLAIACPGLVVLTAEGWRETEGRFHAGWPGQPAVWSWVSPDGQLGAKAATEWRAER